MNDERVVDELTRLADEAQEIDRLKAAGAVELNDDGTVELDLNTATLADVGIVNRRAARAHGMRNPKRPRTGAVPKSRKKKRNRR